MKKYRNIIFYVLTIGIFSAFIYWIIKQGSFMEAGKVSLPTGPPSSNPWLEFKDTFTHQITHPLAILLLQITTIIIVARIFGFICKKIWQPTVIGEILAGIFLGPSVVGMFFPEFSAFIFPPNSLANLQFLSQIGLILFMFVIGMELDLKVLKGRAHEAIVISHASIIFPFALGIGLAYFIYQEFAPPNINFLSFALFTGIAMSITAFPVLARIVQEHGLSKTRLGMIVITCAAADDITAWCILAAVIAIVKAGSVMSSLYIILMALVYVLIMWKLVRPFLKKLGEIYSSKESLSKPVVGIFFIVLLLSAYTAEVIGIHALFGAFLAGVIMPVNLNFRNTFVDKIEDVAVVLLLPLFFVFTGLRTQIGLLNEPGLWGVCAIIIIVAITGKFWGSALAARFVGQKWKDSLIIGALMNTRGLMELIVLNIGYDLGVLTPQVFAMMVIMALVTTFMTSPLVYLFNRIMPDKKTTSDMPTSIIDAAKYSILVCFGSHSSGKNMLRLANSFIKKSQKTAQITALHLTHSNEVTQINVEQYEKSSFKPILLEAKKLGVSVNPLFKVSHDFDKDIVDKGNEGNYDLMMIGLGQSIFEGTVLGKIIGFTSKIINPERLFETITGKEKLFENTLFDDRTRQIIKSVKIPLGILIDKELKKTDEIFIPIFSISDSFLLVYAKKLIHNSNSRITILDATGIIHKNPELQETIQSIEQNTPDHIRMADEKSLEKSFLNKMDMMLISIDSWKTAVETHSTWLSATPSVLIMKP